MANIELELDICPFCEQEECDCGAQYPLSPDFRRYLLGRLEFIQNALFGLATDAPLLSLERIRQDASCFQEMIQELHALLLEKTTATYPSHLRTFLEREL